MNNWPLQRDAVQFYGNPLEGGWEEKSLVGVATPWVTRYDGQVVRSIRVHRLCAQAFGKWFAEIWLASGRSQSVIDSWGMSAFAGSFNLRAKRGASPSNLSMHAFGCAVDFDAARNPFRTPGPHFGSAGPLEGVVVPFRALGGVWGGDWHPADGMHFQFARVS